MTNVVPDGRKRCQGVERAKANDDCGGHSVRMAADQEFAGGLAFTLYSRLIKIANNA